MITLMNNGMLFFFFLLNNIIKVKIYKKLLDAAWAKKADKSFEF